MDRQAVQSSTIKSVGYDEADKVLEVEFHSGGVYTYANVEPKAHAALMGAPSVGKHFHQNIRGAHPSQRRED